MNVVRLPNNYRISKAIIAFTILCLFMLANTGAAPAPLPSGNPGIWELYNTSSLPQENTLTFTSDLILPDASDSILSDTTDPILSEAYDSAINADPGVSLPGEDNAENITGIVYASDTATYAPGTAGYEGYGTYQWVNGDTYTGYWSKGVMNGQGTYIWNNGDKYTGDWTDGAITGYGTYIFANGDKYSGEWVKGIKTGQGIYVLSDGSSFVGIWRSGYTPSGINDGIFTLISSEQTVSKKDIITKQDSVLLVKCYDRYNRLIATGSGFVLTYDGIVATNYHVIQKAYSITVVAADETTTYKINGVVSYDADRDIALLQATGMYGIEPVVLGDSTTADIGDDVIAIGSPYGLQNSISDGIISGLRKFDGYNFIQTTAALSSGSSGGALFNMSGEVIGITSSKIADGENLNFAIPVNDLKEIFYKAVLK